MKGALRNICPVEIVTLSRMHFLDSLLLLIIIKVSTIPNVALFSWHFEELFLLSLDKGQDRFPSLFGMFFEPHLPSSELQLFGFMCGKLTL